MQISKPEVLYSKVIEVAERVTLEAWTERKTPVQIDIKSDPALVRGITGEAVRIIEPISTQNRQISLADERD